METTTIKFISSSDIVAAVADAICKQDANVDHLYLTEEIVNQISDDGEYTFGTNYASLVELAPFVRFCFRVAAAADEVTIHDPATAMRDFWNLPENQKILRSKVKVFVDLET